ncbi:hypothetical protein A9179_14480 [Pseudomonas alcaligenes]|uniref:Electron transporter RnfE n=1 Tax=Aquipseudomonas alcaligenes TaxID=43263 RepID=A0ABR7S3T3_AQUAC|nr:Rnf-Nqr domain containing protein [Pseudomonas alcaligenes]MBC9251475.1 hypothetical protein [Pseudomonas alcaligenes]
MSRQRDSLALLSLAALLGSTDLLVKAVSIGLLGLLLMLLAGLLLQPLRRGLQGQALGLAGLLLGGLLASCAALALQLLSAELFAALALFLPLLALPCLALGDEQGALCGLRPGLRFAALAVLLGLLREGLGQASLLAHADWLFGPAASSWTLTLAPAGLPLLGQAPGALILLGLLLAAARYLEDHHERP